MDDLDGDSDQSHHSDDSCLLHEFTSPVCSSGGRAVSPAKSTTRVAAAAAGSGPARRKQSPCCCSPLSGRTSSGIPCPVAVLTSSRPSPRVRSKFGSRDFDDFRARIDKLKRELRRSSSCSSSDRTTGVGSASTSVVPCCSTAVEGGGGGLKAETDLLACCCRCVSWNVSLLRALRNDSGSIPERRSDGRLGGTRIRQPGRADVGFSPRKGDLIIHHEKTPGRKVLEFYDPVCQRLHDGDILVRFKIDSYACEGIVLVKGSGYLYHRGFWVYLGKDSDQISRSCTW